MERFKPGSRIGNLVVERELGRGAFGHVYLARDTLIDRQVAIKAVRLLGVATEPPERDRVLKEARLAGKLKSPNIATLYRVHPLDDEEGWIFELEYVEGGSLEDLLSEKGSIAPAEALRLGRDILAGLAAAHEAGVVHGDVKPANILLASDGTAKLVDFGLARVAGEISLSQSSSTRLAGTPGYMAPEVVMGDKATEYSDIWSTGVVLYRMLTGAPPFPATSLGDLFHAIQNREPPRLDPVIPSALAELTMRCLAKDAVDRPGSCREALVELEAPGHLRAAPLAPSAAPPLVGRDGERALLLDAAGAVRDGVGQSMVISGAAGIGKSSLAAEIVRRTATLGFHWIRATVTELEGLLRPLLDGVRDRLAARTSGTHGLLGSSADVLQKILSEDSPIRLDSKDQAVWVLERLLTGMAEARPLGVLLDGVHRADPDERRMLEEMARRLRDARILLLMLSDADSDGLAASEDVRQIHLDPLSSEEIYRLLEIHAAGPSLDPEIPQHLVRAAEGNPLFTIELFRHLRESGALVEEEQVLRPSRMWRATRLPRRLREIVALRLSALPDEQRSLLDVAAVDGVAFDGDAIAAAIDRSLLDVLRVLQNVYRNTELILPSEDGWRFANATFQEGIYEDLASDLRRVLHRRLAEHLEARGESVDPERLGVHWERAGESERAAPYLNRAALLAALRQEHLRAIDLATRSGLFPDGIRPESACDQAELVFTMAGGLSDMGRTQDAAALVERMLDAATAVGEEQLLLRSVVWREDIRLHSEAGASVDLAELRRAAESLADSLELGRARYLLGTIADRRGDLDEAERWMKLAIEIFGRCGPAWMHSSSLDKLAQIAAHRGRNLEAEALYADAARIAEHSGRRLSAAVSHVNRVLSAFDRGESKELEPQLGNAVRTFRLSGMDAHAGQTLVHLARIRYDHGDLRGAESALEEALAILEGADRPLVLSFAFREKAYLDATRGRLREANEHLRTARSLAESAGAEFAMVKTACVKTHCLCFAGDREEAANRAQTALRLSGEMTRRTLADWLAEASVYGLPASALRECMAQQPPRDESTLAGAIALAEDSGDADALRTAASAFRDPAIGERRALMHAVADLFLAEALRREGDEKAQDRAEAALQGAERVGHVWLQATALRLLSRLSPESDFASRLRAHVAAVAKTAGDERISSVWAP